MSVSNPESTLSAPHVVWFKKDLRVSDHQALRAAMTASKHVLGLYIIEDEWLSSPEFSGFHLQFLKDSLIDLEVRLGQCGVPLLIVQGSCLSILQKLKTKLNFHHLYSHEETGVDWTYQRDKNVKTWCHEQSIQWHEFLQFAVKRGVINRDRWNKFRKKVINRACLATLQHEYYRFDLHAYGHIPATKIACPEFPYIQRGGRQQGLNYLVSFLNRRGQNYTYAMSSPNTAYEQCSRLSPYLTWGNLSLSEVTSALEATRERLHEQPKHATKAWRRSLKSFESRLWWHCHFIQKLESEPEMEFRNVNRAFDGMREANFNETRFAAWCKGETGYPMIDACMRALHKHGWINFRMRAMLISFASYQLWLHWRRPAQYLAQLFVDFEPGIHFSQVQMQSGVTGINTIRMYSPLKQAEDQDPQGVFIKKFCPELKQLDGPYVFQPHLLPPLDQTMSNFKIGRDYPEPIVDHKQAYNYAKEQIFTWRSKPEVKTFAKQVYNKHGSRKNEFFPTQHRQPFGNLSCQQQRTKS